MNQSSAYLSIPALLLAMLLSGCGDSEQPARSTPADSGNPIQVQVAPVEALDGQSGRTLAGVVGPVQRARMGTRQAGTVKQVLVEAGDAVEAGQPIIRIDARDLEAARRAARQQLQAARQAWEVADNNEQRFRRLFEQQLIAKARLEEAEVAASGARGRLQQAEAELAAIGVNIDYATVQAPFDGVVSEIIAEVGTFVAPGPALVIFEDRSRLEVNAAIDQASAAELAPGDVIEMNASGLDAALRGRVQAVLPALRATGVGQRLRLVIDDPPPQLAPGMIVELRLPAGDTAYPVVSIPASAVWRRGQLDGVFVVETDREQRLRARLRWVSVAPRSRGGSSVQILQGLSPGERVVVGDAVTSLVDGQLIAPRLIEPASP